YPYPDDDLVMHFVGTYWMINRSSYLSKRDRVPRAPDMMGFWLRQLDAGRFTQGFRVTRFQSTQIVELIQGHADVSNNLNDPQAPAWCQLMVALYRFGCDGNGASIRKLARHFRCSAGTIEIFTSRCIEILPVLEGRAVMWPEVQEREENQMNPTYTYYGMAGIVVCGDHKRIRFGTRCTLDGKQRAKFMQKRDFEGDQYLLAGSGLRHLRSAHLSEAYGVFNRELSKSKVWNEHCIGILKGRVGDSEGDYPNVWIPVVKELPYFIEDGNFDNALTRTADTAGKLKRLRVMQAC
ncbi:putative DDE Tnp4 domain-containing protein, partial [Phytophthora infestans]